MLIKKYIKCLESIIKELVKSESSGHDLYHLKRVLNLALRIQKQEGGDRLVIGVAAFVHDIHRIVQKETGQYCSPKDSLPKVAKILQLAHIPENRREHILHCVEFHEEYGFGKTGITATDIETLVLQDADNLDAIGAIGIARTFAYGGTNDILMWNQDRTFKQDPYTDSSHDPSTIHHFYSKLLRLKDNMNTKTSYKIAKGRHAFMEEYLKRFFSEWKGTD